MTKTYKAYVTEKTSGTNTIITSDYTNKKDFAHDLRQNGYTVHFVALADNFESESEKYNANLNTRRVKASAIRKVLHRNTESESVNTEFMNNETNETNETNNDNTVTLSCLDYKENKRFNELRSIDNLAIGKCTIINTDNGTESKLSNHVTCTLDKTKIVHRIVNKVVTEKELTENLNNALAINDNDVIKTAVKALLTYRKSKKKSTIKGIPLSELIANVEKAFLTKSSDLGVHVLRLSKAMATNVIKQVYKVVPDSDIVRTMYYDVFRFNCETSGLENLDNTASDHIMQGASLIYESLLNGHMLDDVIEVEKPTKKAYVTSTCDMCVKMKTVQVSVFKIIYNGIRKSISSFDTFKHIDNKLTYIELEKVIENETIETWINTVYDVSDVYTANRMNVNNNEDLDTIESLIEKYELNKTEKRIVLYRMKVGAHVGYKALSTALNMPLPTVKSSVKRMQEKTKLTDKRDNLISDIDTKVKQYSNFRLALISDLICSDMSIKNEMCFMIDNLANTAKNLGVNCNVKTGTISDSLKIAEIKHLANMVSSAISTGKIKARKTTFDKSDISITVKPYKVSLIKKCDILDSTQLNHDSNRKTIATAHGTNIDITKSINSHINALNLSESIRVHIARTLENMHANKA